MNRFLKLLLMLMPLMAGVTACESDGDDSAIAIDLGTKIDGVILNSGEIFEMKVSAYASENPLTNAHIETYDTQRGMIVVSDSTISGMTYKHNYYYRVPQLEKDTMDLRFTFSFTNTKGYTHSIYRTAKVVRQNEVLEERFGVILYSDEQNGTYPNAYCFSEMRPVIYSLADSAQIDMYIPPIEVDSSTAAMREWLTNTDIDFARSNSFDFPNATSISIAAAYSSCVRNPKITNLQDGDIILVGRGSTPVGVIQIVNIFDPDSYSKCRYLLNIKALKR